MRKVLMSINKVGICASISCVAHSNDTLRSNNTLRSTNTVLTQYYVKHMYAGEYDISALHLAALHGHTDTVER